MKDQTSSEARFYGMAWDEIHGGYFGDAMVAEPLLAAVGRSVEATWPGCVADLGGGTGFLIEELARRMTQPDLTFVNVDIAEKQMRAHVDGRVRRLHRSATEVTRPDLGVAHRPLLLVMRSVLHYAGKDGMKEFLRHVRRQMKPGEHFVHQTACFADARHAACFNRLYELLHTHKWYPTVAELTAALVAEDFEVRATLSAPALTLSGQELGARYEASAIEMASIGNALHREFGEIPGVLERTAPTFVACLHYKIFTCVAAA